MQEKVQDHTNFIGSKARCGSDQKSKYMELLTSLEQIIFNLNEKNLETSIEQTMNLFDANFPDTFNLVIYNLIYFSFYTKADIKPTYLKYLEILQNKEEEIKINNSKIIKKFIENIKKMEEKFYSKQNCSEAPKNNIEIHEQLIKEKHNPTEIAKIIQNDEIQKLQEISSQNDFDFNQRIKPSPYEMCDFINSIDVSLIDYAAFFRSVNCFKYLLLNHANVSNTGKYAVAGGNLEIIHLCEQNHSTFDGAYEAAIKFHRNDIFHYLYENKLENLVENISGLITLSVPNPLLLKPLTRVTFQSGGSKNINSLGIFCVQSGNYSTLLFLEKEGMKIDDSIINKSATHGNLYLVKYFLQSNPIPKDILLFSSESGNIELVKNILEQKGVDINACDSCGATALMYASRNGLTETVKLLLQQKGINVNSKDGFQKTALLYAYLFGHTEIVQLLLQQKGIDVNYKDNQTGETILYFASSHGDTDIVKLLLDHKGINVNLKTKNGYSPLLIASKKCYPEIVKLLLEHKGIDIDTKDNRFRTPLMHASLLGHTEVAKLLLAHKGINVNAKDKKTNTALIFAAKNGHSKIVKLLIDHENFDNSSIDIVKAYRIANENGYRKIVKILNEKQRFPYLRTGPIL